MDYRIVSVPSVTAAIVLRSLPSPLLVLGRQRQARKVGGGGSLGKGLSRPQRKFGLTRKALLSVSRSPFSSFHGRAICRMKRVSRKEITKHQGLGTVWTFARSCPDPGLAPLPTFAVCPNTAYGRLPACVCVLSYCDYAADLLLARCRFSLLRLASLSMPSRLDLPSVRLHFPGGWNALTLVRVLPAHRRLPSPIRALQCLTDPPFQGCGWIDSSPLVCILRGCRMLLPELLKRWQASDRPWCLRLTAMQRAVACLGSAWLLPWLLPAQDCPWRKEVRRGHIITTAAGLRASQRLRTVRVWIKFVALSRIGQSASTHDWLPRRVLRHHASASGRKWLFGGARH